MGPEPAGVVGADRAQVPEGGAFGLTEAGLAGTAAWAARHRRPALAALAAVGGAAAAGSAASYLYSTGPGKRAIWAQLLDELGLRDDERVLDVGCGRGAVLMLAAGRVPAGRAVGVDVWRRRDLSGNSRAAAERNAVAEGVADRVEVADADARDLPFGAGCADVAVRQLGWRTWYGLPGHHIPLVAATRPVIDGVEPGPGASAARCQRTRGRLRRG